ncbi:MAG: hypothetical protein ACOX7Q_16480, partial [Kiritimatiellia bacterium]
MAVTFLAATRLQQQATAAATHRLAARNQLNEALHLAMRTVEDAFCTANFADAPFSVDSGSPVPQRLAPVGRWFSDKWEGDNIENPTGPNSVEFQAPGVLASPPIQKSAPPVSPPTPEFTTSEMRDQWTVNLLTPEVRALIPPALTNGIDLTSSTSPFRSSWHSIEVPGEPWRDTAARVAFAVFDVSGFLDANHFLTGPTTQKLPRVCFSQADVTNWFAHVDHEKIEDLKSQIPDLESNPDRMPFSSLSYDPNPNIHPLETESITAIPNLGTHAFAPASKFNINSLTNHFLSLAGVTRDGADKSRLVVMSERWFRNVTGVLQSASIDLNHLERADGRDAYFGDARKVAWNIVSQMTPSRIPTAFDGDIISQNAYAHRLDYAIEAVPL